MIFFQPLADFKSVKHQSALMIKIIWLTSALWPLVDVLNFDWPVFCYPWVPWTLFMSCFLCHFSHHVTKVSANESSHHVTSLPMIPWSCCEAIHRKQAMVKGCHAECLSSEALKTVKLTASVSPKIRQSEWWGFYAGTLSFNHDIETHLQIGYQNISSCIRYPAIRSSAEFQWF